MTPITNECAAETPETRSDSNRSDSNRSDSNRSDSNRSDSNRSDADHSEATAPDVRPDVQRTVLAATRIAGQRRMPLRVESLLAGINAAPSANGTSNGNSASSNGKNGNGTSGNGAKSNGKTNAATNGANNIEYSNGASLNGLATNGSSTNGAMKNGAAQNGARRVDIGAVLDGIAPQMQGVEDEIARLITSPIKLVSDIAGHTLGAGGKRLRPALTILASQLCSGEVNARALTCAAVMEITHTTALIHDDVVDNAQTRRGKPAANLLWGNETSVLVGDYLSAQAFIAMTKPEFHDVLPFVAQTTSELCAGELLETQTRGLLTLSEAQYLDIIALKTASLTACACRVGAIASGADEIMQEKMARYGRFLGMAFQIVDDVFDVTSSEARVGKPVGNDIREGDITLPMLRAMQVVSPGERDELSAIVGKDPICDDEVHRALAILRGCDAVEYSLQMARRFVASAKNELNDCADSAAKTALRDIADYVLSREK